MARGRMLSTAVARDRELNALDVVDAYLYVTTLPHLDRDGLAEADPMLLWAQVAPLRRDLIDRMPQAIEAWVAAGLVVRYPTKEGAALFFKGFPRHNVGIVYRKEPPSRFPCPPGFRRTHAGLVPEDGATAAAWAESVNPKSDYYRALMEVATSAGSVQADVATSTRQVQADVATSAGTLQVQPEGCDRKGRDIVATSTRRTEVEHEVEVEVEHEVEHDGDGDHTLTHTPVLGMGGSAEGGAGAGKPANGTVSAGELVYAFTPEQLRAAAYELGSVLGLHMGWTNYAGFLGKREPGSLAVLLEWLEFYGSMPEQALAKIDNLAGLIRSHLNKGERAPLTGAQKKHLVASVVEALAAEAAE